MHRFYKIGLLLGFASIVTLQNQSVQAADPNAVVGGDQTREPKKTSQDILANVLTGYFKFDPLESPFAKRSQSSSVARFAQKVVQNMVEGNAQALEPLFYAPVFSEWKKVYEEVTGKKDFSTVNLINFLDQTKTSIFGSYKDVKLLKKPGFALEAYFYVPTLIDNALQQIFTGCWGISDQPTEPGLVDHLKQVYGKVVSGMMEAIPQNNLSRTLADKKQSDKKNQAHFDALLGIVTSPKQQGPWAGVGLSEQDFQHTAGALLNPAPLPQQDGQEPIEYQQLDKWLNRLGESLSLTGADPREIGTTIFKIVSKLDAESDDKKDAEKVIEVVKKLAQNLDQESGPVIMFETENQIQNLLQKYYQASPDDQPINYWPLLSSDPKRPVFPLADTVKDIVYGFEFIKNQKKWLATNQIVQELKGLVKYLATFTSKEQEDFFKTLTTILKGGSRGNSRIKPHQDVKEAGNEYLIWLALLEDPVLLPTQRGELMKKMIAGLKTYVAKKPTKEVEKAVETAYRQLKTKKDQNDFMQELEKPGEFKMLGEDLHGKKETYLMSLRQFNVR